MELLLVENIEPGDEHYTTQLRECLGEVATLTSINYRNVPSIDELEMFYDGVVTSGTPLSYPLEQIDTRVPHIRGWITDTRLPVLGICLGHQNLGRLYNADLLKGVEREEGSYPLSFIDEDPLFDGIEPGEMVTEHHNASVTVPKGFRLLASTATCRNQSMRHPERPVYGTQFHPEESGDTGMKIFRNFVRIAKDLRDKRS